MKFSTTCRKHGAAAPQVKKKARERLLELVDPALASLDKVLRDEKTDDNAKIKAAIAVLDRTGFRPGVVVQVSTGDEWGSIFSDALTDTDDRALPGAPTVLELDRGTADYDQGRRDQEDRDDEDHGSTRLDHENYDVVLVPRRSSGPGPFADPNRPPADPRSQHDPSEAATARAFEARLRDRIEGR